MEPLSIRVVASCAQTKAPEGWWCTRDINHEGPCAAIPIDNARHLAKW